MCLVYPKEQYDIAEMQTFVECLKIESTIGQYENTNKYLHISTTVFSIVELGEETSSKIKSTDFNNTFNVDMPYADTLQLQKNVAIKTNEHLPLYHLSWMSILLCHAVQKTRCITWLHKRW